MAVRYSSYLQGQQGLNLQTAIELVLSNHSIFISLDLASVRVASSNEYFYRFVNIFCTWVKGNNLLNINSIRKAIIIFQ